MSGKTTIALAKANARIRAGLLPGQSILFLSFSRAAVSRIIEASKTQVPKEYANSLSIQTFHSSFGKLFEAMAIFWVPLDASRFCYHMTNVRCKWME